MVSSGIRAEPVFIVGMNGSGTTMLLDNLGRHSALYAFPRETRLIPYLIANLHRFGDLGQDSNFCRLWEEVLGMTVFTYANNNHRLMLPDDWRNYPRDLASVLDGVFRNFAAREGKQRWCEKSPQYVQHIRSLSQLFPRARFIHVIRDGRDSAASFYRRWRRTPELSLYRWKKVVLEGRRQGLALGEDRYMEIRYEDITKEPEAYLKQICVFLCLPFEAAILQSAQPYLKTVNTQSSEETTGSLRPNSGAWRTKFSTRKISCLERIGGSTLALYGYDTSMPESDYDPPRYRRYIWQLCDDLVQYIREIVFRLIGRNRKPWRVILSRPLVAFRHREGNKY
jgi:hypothetical protein